MRWIRPQLARAAAGWLVVHLCLLLAVPTALCTTMSISAKAECTCEHGDGQMCPMHHTRSKSKSPTDPHSCSCRSTSDPVAAMAAALIGPAAVIASSLTVTEPTTPAALLPVFDSVLVESPFVSDSPPPRA